MHKGTNVRIQQPPANMIHLWLNTVIFVYKYTFSTIYFLEEQNFLFTLVFRSKIFRWNRFSVDTFCICHAIANFTVTFKIIDADFVFARLIKVTNTHVAEHDTGKRENCAVLGRCLAAWFFFSVFPRRTVVSYWNVITK